MTSTLLLYTNLLAKISVVDFKLLIVTRQACGVDKKILYYMVQMNIWGNTTHTFYENLTQQRWKNTNKAGINLPRKSLRTWSKLFLSAIERTKNMLKFSDSISRLGSLLSAVTHLSRKGPPTSLLMLSSLTGCPRSPWLGLNWEWQNPESKYAQVLTFLTEPWAAQCDAQGHKDKQYASVRGLCAIKEGLC